MPPGGKKYKIVHESIPLKVPIEHTVSHKNPLLQLSFWSKKKEWLILVGDISIIIFFHHGIDITKDLLLEEGWWKSNALKNLKCLRAKLFYEDFIKLEETVHSRHLENFWYVEK